MARISNNHNTRTFVVKCFCRIFALLVCACAVSCRTTAPVTSSRVLTTTSPSFFSSGSAHDPVFLRTGLPTPQHFPSNVSAEPPEPAALTNLGEELAAGSNSAAVESCILVPQDPFQHQIIYDMVNIQGLKLIEYLLVFPNNSVNPLKTNMTKTFKGDSWARVNNAHGQTLLSLAFNYGILSLMTLTFGTDRLPINVEDRPRDCMLALTEDEKLRVTLRLLMRDFDWQSQENITLKSAERLCHEVVANSDGYARFTDRCCFRDRLTGSAACSAQYANGWLTFLYIMLTSIRFGILAFGPLMFLSTLSGLIREEFPYTVELRDPLIKTMVLYRKSAEQQVIPAMEEIKGKHKLDLSRCGGFPKLREIVLNDLAPIGHPFKAKFTQYDINVSYKRLLTENKVPVGFWRSLAQSVFYCKLRHIGPFQKCCRADMLRNRTCRHGVERACGSACGIRSPLPWIRLWKKIGLLLLIFLLPTPYYIRLAIMYVYEYDEVIARKAAASELGLHESFENSLMHYFMPTHWLFIGIYVVYLVMAFNLSYLARRNEKGRFRKIIVGSFTDLKNLSWMNVLKMMVANVIWPFQRFGLAGCLVVIVYWPIVLPLTSLVYVLYVLPTVYLTVRMFFYSKMAFLKRARKRPVKRSYRVKHNVDDTVHFFEAGYLLGDGDSDKESRSAGTRTASGRHSHHSDIRRSASVRSNGRNMRESVIMSEELDDVSNINRDFMVPKDQRSISMASTIMASVKGGGRVGRILEHCLASLLCVAALYSVLVILSECVGCFAEMLVFTLMGIIVNAGQLLKYVALIVMLVVYSYDCFNNVEKKYLKLNRALFSEVKSRIKDLEKVTSLPSFLQENRGFKSQELGEQAEYELSDDVSDKPARHWLINDLVLFIDNEDMPRIPRKLFEDVCRIRVAGVPGPVYRGQLLAIRQFLKIVVFIFFVFIVILSFGSVYKVSDTNQMIAALAGGSLPFILRTVMEPEKPDIEIGTVSFKNQMDEVIRNFVQYWPIYDLPFHVYTDEEQARDRQRAEEEEEAERLAKAAFGSRHGSAANLLQSHGQLQHRDSLALLLANRPASEPTRTSETFHTCLPTVDPPSFYNNNLDYVDGRPKSSREEVRQSRTPPPPVGNHVDAAGADGDADAVPPRSPKAVMFRDPSKEELPVPEVDIVVYLPNKHDEVWLDEWSDCDTETEAEHRTDSLDDADVFGGEPLEMRDFNNVRVPAAAAPTYGTTMRL